jgi:hypothetical protein
MLCCYYKFFRFSLSFFAWNPQTMSVFLLPQFEIHIQSIVETGNCCQSKCFGETDPEKFAEIWISFCGSGIPTYHSWWLVTDVWKSNFSVLVCRNGTPGGVSEVEFGMVPEVKQTKFPTPSPLYYLISSPSVRRTLTLRKCHLVTFNCFPQK